MTTTPDYRKIEFIDGVPHLSYGKRGLTLEEAIHEFSTVYQGDYDVIPVVEGSVYKLVYRTPA